MRVYFIDAKHELICETNVKNWEHKCEVINARNLERLYKQINGNDIWFDEESNLKEYNYFFQIDDVVVSGNAIINGEKNFEDSDVANLTLEELQSRVKFMGKRYIDHSKLKFEVTEWK